MSHKIIPCHINDLRIGDTVLHNGQMITVSKSNLKRGGFCGTTLAGDSYRGGSQQVQRVEFITSQTKSSVTGE
jgi:hypothetical protein